MRPRICRKCHKPCRSSRKGLCTGCEKDMQAFKAWEQKLEAKRLGRVLGHIF